MWILFKHFIIEYNYCKMHRTPPLKGQISTYKLEGKSISFIARELSRSLTVIRNYLKDPKLYGIRKHPSCPPKITNAARRWPFREASKGHSSSRDLQKSQLTHHSKKSLSTSPWIVKSCISKQKHSPCFNYLTQKDVHRLGKEKSNMDKREMGKLMFSDEKKVWFGWAWWLPVLLVWFKKGEAAVLQKKKHLEEDLL